MSVELAKNGAGDYAIGATIEDVFIPLVSVSAARVRQLQDRYADLVKKGDDATHEGHGPALDVLDADWKVVKPKTSSKAGSKTKEDEG